MNDLLYAVSDGLAAVRRALSAGANPRATNSHGDTALHKLCAHFDSTSGDETDKVEIAMLLINAGVDVNAVGLADMAALHWACQTGSWQLIKVLIDAGADVRADQRGRQPIHVAAEFGDDDALRLLVGAGADFNAKYGGKTPLDLAVKKSHSNAATFLQTKGAKHGGIRGWFG